MHPIDFRIRQERQDNPADFGAVGLPDEPAPYLVWDELEDAMPRKFIFQAGVVYGVILGLGLAFGLIWMLR